MITTRACRRLLLGIVLAGAALPSSAWARGESYVGTWASDPAQCKLGQDAENAPLIMKKNRYDRHEAHCAFRSIRREGATWHVRALCTVEGDKRKRGLTLKVTGAKLAIAYSDGGSENYQRCP